MKSGRKSNISQSVFECVSKMVERGRERGEVVERGREGGRGGGGKREGGEVVERGFLVEGNTT